MLARLLSALFLAAIALAAPTGIAGAAHAQTAAATEGAQTAWRLLDYIAVDYAGAVDKGRIINAGEYAEMVEFAEQAHSRIVALPAKPARAGLEQQVAGLQAAIAGKAAAAEVARRAHAAGAELIRIYPVPLAPTQAPSAARGAELYRAQCATCHGANGDGHGPAAAGLDPPPIAFTDRDRALQRSVFGLQQVIAQGLDGTSMQSYAELPPADRWALAFHVSALAFAPAEVRRGKEIWDSDAKLRRALTPEKLVMTTPAALAGEIGAERADAVTAYLRHDPDAAFAERQAGALEVGRSRLADALAAYQAGDARRAGNLALSAYLDGFEPIEPVVAARDRTLVPRVEAAMADVRSSIAKGAPIDTVRAHLHRVDQLFAEVEQEMAGGTTSASASFLGAFTILAREGLEALLIVVAMIAFLQRAERREVLPYVHGGWVAALVAGALTWGAATWLIEISGASRELTEGFGSVLAAVVLLWVGLWMHGKSHAQGWQTYIHNQLAGVLSRPSGSWLVFGLAFVVVYREVFETILFYTALWAQGNGHAVLAGAAAAVLFLAIVAWIMFRYSRRLPLREFFLYTSGLIAILAVVLIGKGVAALQEAGYLPVTPVAGVPRIELLGLFPSVEGVAAQVLMIGCIVAGVLWNQRRAAHG